MRHGRGVTSFTRLACICLVAPLWSALVQARRAGSAGMPPVTEKPVLASPSGAEDQQFAIAGQVTFVV